MWAPGEPPLSLVQITVPYLFCRFGIFLGISFNENANTLQLAMHGPIEVAIGLSFGLGWGLLAQWLPSKDNPNHGFFR